MELTRLPSVLARWRWVIVGVVAVGGVLLGVRLATIPTVYEARARLQITAPQIEDIPIQEPGNRSSSFLRDDLILVRNNLAVLAASPEVYGRTVRALGFRDSGPASEAPPFYQVEVRPLRDSDYVDIIATSSLPGAAQRIVNLHAAQTIQYYGELRAMPAAATKNFLASQLATPSPAFNDPMTEEMAQLLRRKHAAATLAEELALRANHVQIVEPAVTVAQRGWTRNLVVIGPLVLVGSLGLGLVLALLLEALSTRRLASGAQQISVLGLTGAGGPERQPDGPAEPHAYGEAQRQRERHYRVTPLSPESPIEGRALADEVMPGAVYRSGALSPETRQVAEQMSLLSQYVQQLRQVVEQSSKLVQSGGPHGSTPTVPANGRVTHPLTKGQTDDEESGGRP